MRNIFRLALALLALVSAQVAFSQVPATHRSGKEIYDQILKCEQRGRAMIDQSFKGLPVDDKELLANFDEGLAAADELEKLAKAGDTEARYFMGMYHIHFASSALASAQQNANDATAATLADQEFKKAVEWLKPLAEQNVPQAQWVYGELFAHGHGLNKSDSNAIDWWFKAAQTFLKAGDRESALTLFDMMRNADQSSPRVAQLRKSLFPN